MDTPVTKPEALALAEIQGGAGQFLGVTKTPERGVSNDGLASIGVFTRFLVD